MSGALHSTLRRSEPGALHLFHSLAAVLRILLSLLCLVLATPSGVAGQERFLGGDATVQALALGGTGLFSSRAPGLIHYNPASARSASGTDGSYWTTDAHWTGAALAAGGSGLAVSLRSLSGSFDRSQLTRPASNDLLVSGAAAITFKDIDIGVMATYGERASRDSRARVLRLSAGALVDVDVVTVGVSVSDIGEPASTAPAAIPQAVLTQFQVSTDQAQVGPLDVAGAARLAHRDGRTITGGGLEVSYWPVTGRTFRLLGGFTGALDGGNPYPTFGAAFTGDRLTFEYASADLSYGRAHRFGIRWR